MQAIPRSALIRIVAATAAALAFACAIYALIEATQPSGGLVSFTFLILLPAALSAFVAYIADPWKTRSLRQYLTVPLWLHLTAIIASVIVLREGVVCIVLLTPLWVLSGVGGAWLTYRLRRRAADGRAYCTALLIAPLLAMQVEPMIPLPVAGATVTRSIEVDATPATLWPLLEGIGDVSPDEGAWNISQDVIGIPRPLGAQLVGTGLGAERLARWDQGIAFRERITEWQPGRRIGWRFEFDDPSGWAFTDRHLTPDSPYFRITTGGYSMTPLPGGRTRLTINTSYVVRTPVNGYSVLWGEFFLGDLERNLLALVKQRAERR